MRAELTKEGFMLSRFRLSRGFAACVFALSLTPLSVTPALAQSAGGMRSRSGVPLPAPAGRASAEVALACPSSCNDFDGCTDDSCDTTTGTCRHVPHSCDDGNACTVDSCVRRAQPKGFASCVNSPVVDHTACEDGSSCTVRDECSAGVCTPGPALEANASCDDGNPCTDHDTCDTGHHCAGVPLGSGAACDDANACTSDDRCVEEDGAVRCSGAVRDCTDGDLCTQDVCDPATGVCAHPPVDCQDGNSCTTDACDPGTGLCRRDNVPGSCDDANGCTSGDACVGGNCAGQPITCHANGACDRTFCDSFDDVCKHFDDQSLCPPPGQCSGPVCTHGVCQYTGWSGTPCSLGERSCSIGLCVRGECTPDGTFPCNDNNPCTDDTCGPSNFICNPTPKPDGTPCPAGPCSAGTCQAGVCSGLTVSCDDANPCTVDSCDAATGCVHAPLGCDDGNPCTADSCSTASGACVHAPLSNVPCGGDACNRTFCDNGACTEVEPNLCDDHDACTVDRCDPVSGCSHEAVSCDDGNRCTADSCDSNQGCVHDGPAQPAKEACNGLDDDCDGLVDERETMPFCAVRPLIARDGGTLPSFTVSCRWAAACGPAAPPEPIGTVWLSAADALLDPADNKALPDPFAHCAEAIVENGTRRMISDGAITFLFDPSGNGVCGTTGGGRAGLVAALAGVPDGKLARVCVKWRNVALADTERCGVVLVQHGTSTEPQPLQVAPEDEDTGLLRPAP